VGPLLDAFQGFRREGRARFLGFTGLGDTAGVQEVIASGGFDLFHCYYNTVNPSAAYAMPSTFAPQDLGQIMVQAAAQGMGVLAIRILAAGAASGVAERHALAGGSQGVLISGTDYARDEQRAARIRPLAEELGISLAELSIRFALSRPELSCALVGISSLDQVEFAAKAAEGGPLPDDVVARIVQANDDEG
jgi:aryl-alcohol dehydrogenase-like predicted oxidoreductase